MHAVYASLDSRMAIETFREQVAKVLHIWQAWSLFPLSFTSSLERRFLHGDQDADDPAAAGGTAVGGAPPKGGRAGADAGGALRASSDPEGGRPEGGDSDAELDGEPLDLSDGCEPPVPLPAEVIAALFLAPPRAALSADHTAGGAPLATAFASTEGGAGAGAGAAEELGAREARVCSFGLRELEAVLEASGLSASGSRSEMLTRLLVALRSGAHVAMDAKPAEMQTLAVASRWDGDADDEAKRSQVPSAAAAVAPPAAVAAAPPPPAPSCAAGEDIDGEDIDGEDIDGEALTPAAGAKAGASQGGGGGRGGGGGGGRADGGGRGDSGRGEPGRRRGEERSGQREQPPPRERERSREREREREAERRPRDSRDQQRRRSDRSRSRSRSRERARPPKRRSPSRSRSRERGRR